MNKPSHMTVFDTLYAIAASDGREAPLFGQTLSLARPAFEKTLIGENYPTVYLEFPLLGEPRFDFLTVYTSVPTGAQFAPGAGFGYQRMFDWFSGIRLSGVSCGLEVDCGEGETERAGVYLQQFRHSELVAPFLSSIGEEARTTGYLSVLGRMPPGWNSAYVGLFPGRAGTPLRIGGYLKKNVKAACAADPAFLADQFDRIGFSAYDGAMLARCAEFMALVPSVDFQFDILADGTLADVFGLSLSFNETKPRNARACMESGYGAKLMGRLEALGLADDRWKKTAGAAFARAVPFSREDGSRGRLALCCLLNYAKVKFKASAPCPAKFYFALKAAEISSSVPEELFLAPDQQPEQPAARGAQISAPGPVLQDGSAQ